HAELERVPGAAGEAGGGHPRRRRPALRRRLPGRRRDPPNPVEDGFDFLAADSYKWMMGPRGMGYLYLSKAAQERFRPVTMGWRSGRHPQESYYGVDMDLSPSASRFDSSLSWIAVVGDRESLGLLTTIGAGRIEAHNL